MVLELGSVFIMTIFVAVRWICHNHLAIKIHVLCIFLVIDEATLLHISYISEPQFSISHKVNGKTKFSKCHSNLYVYSPFYEFYLTLVLINLLEAKKNDYVFFWFASVDLSYNNIQKSVLHFHWDILCKSKYLIHSVFTML